MLKRIRVIFNGRIQGVGFRFTAQSIARSMGIVGWVKNLRGGDVEILAEADEGTLKSFVSKIEDEFSGYIRDKEIVWEGATGEFKGFGINY